LRRIIIFIIILTGTACGMSKKAPIITPPPEFNRDVPVQLSLSEYILISVRGDAVLECYRDSDLGEIYYFESSIEFRIGSNGLSVYDENGLLTDGLAEVKCIPRNPKSVLEFENKGYRGIMRVVTAESSSKLYLFNIVDLEDYLKGVLPAEIGNRNKKEFQSAKAQAVAARTYAVWKLLADGSSGKLYPTIADQVYIGMDSEYPLLNKAIKETTGEVLAVNEKPIAAYYHAVCGGETIPVGDAWPQRDPQTYLVGADDDDYCKWARTYSWTEFFNLETLRTNLKNYFKNKGSADITDFDNIIDIEFNLDYESGRVRLMEVFTDNKTYKVEKDQIRWALGRPSSPGAILPSTKFTYEKTVTPDGSWNIVISGFGNGHGVGACQCGVIGRARDGQKYDKILKKYYRGASLVRLY